MTITDEQLATLPDTAREAFLQDANKLVANVRASVFIGCIRNTFAGRIGPDAAAERGHWQVEDIVWSAGRRADMLVRRDGGVEHRVVAVFAPGDEGRDLLEATRGRLSPLSSNRANHRPIIVIPNCSNSETSSDGDPIIVKLRDLITLR